MNELFGNEFVDYEKKTRRWIWLFKGNLMNVYLALLFAILFEVTGTMLLPVTKEFSKFIPTSLVIIFYSLSFYLLSVAVVKLPLSIVYASWAGLGVFSVAILSYLFYKQTLNFPTIIGLFLIVIGVVLVNVFKTD